MDDKGIISSEEFGALAREHHRRLLAYTLGLVRNKTVAEDIVQEALLTAYLRIDSFDRAQSFPAWVRGICRNKYLEWCRANKKYVLNDSLLDQLDETHQSWDELETERNDSFRILAICIETLSTPAKKVVDSFYFKKITCIDLAEASKETVAAIQKRLQRARQSLQQCITESLKAEKKWGRSK